MYRGFNELKESTSVVKRPIDSNHRTEGNASYDIHSSKSRCIREGSLRTYGLPIILISIIAMLAITLPGCANADLNQSLKAGSGSNQTTYLDGFNEGYYLGGLFVLAQSNATFAEKYNVLIQQHNDFLNKTLSREEAESNLLTTVPIPAIAPKKPVDPWEI
ncbi:MAG: hypothetical protein ACE14P_14885 [Methanotrichaceae archaeon]